MGAGRPSTVGAYRILRLLGTGGMGSVYLAQGAGVDPVALKLLHSRLADDPAAGRRFEREIEAVRRVPGWCTARLLDAGLHGRLPYLVSEYVEGPTLGAIVRQRGALSGSDAAGLAAGTALALVAVHGAGIVHRDLKPSNIILSAMGPRVVDFGIALLNDGVEPVTVPDQVVGSPGWMSPEQISGTAVAASGDVFCWGLVVCFAATGRHPFGEGDRRAIGYRTLTSTADLRGVPAELRGLVQAALSPQPQHRPSARDIVDSLTGGTTSISPAWTQPLTVLASGGPAPATTAPHPAAADPTQVQMLALPPDPGPHHGPFAPGPGSGAVTGRVPDERRGRTGRRPPLWGTIGFVLLMLLLLGTCDADRAPASPGAAADPVTQRSGSGALPVAGTQHSGGVGTAVQPCDVTVLAPCRARRWLALHRARGAVRGSSARRGAARGNSDGSILCRHHDRTEC